MNQKGFTLVEIIAVISIILIILLIATPKVLEIIQESKQNAYNHQIDMIKRVAKEYTTKYSYNLTWNDDDVAAITLGDLIDNGLVKDNVKNPITNQIIGDNELKVYVYQDNKKYGYIVEDLSPYYNETTINKTYGGSNDEVLIESLKIKGGYLLLGESKSTNGDITDGNNGNYDAVVMKIDNNGNKVWDKTFGGSNEDFFQQAVETSTGYLLLGLTYSNDGDITDGNAGSADIWVVFIDKSGTKQWDKTYGGSGHDSPYTFAVNIDNDGYLIAGETNSNDGDITDGNNGSYDLWFLEINNTGVIQWNKTYGGDYDEFGDDMVTVSDGYIIVGDTASYNEDITDDTFNETDGGCDGLIFKINKDGTKIWDKAYGGTNNEFFNAIITTSDGKLLIVGETYSIDGDIADRNSEDDDDFLAIKTDATGTAEWIKTYGTADDDWALDVYEEDNGAFIISGNRIYTSEYPQSYDALYYKISPAGNEFYNKIMGGAGTADDWTKYGYLENNGMYVMACNTKSNNGDIVDGNNGGQDFWFLRMKPNFTY